MPQDNAGMDSLCSTNSTLSHVFIASPLNIPVVSPTIDAKKKVAPKRMGGQDLLPGESMFPVFCYNNARTN